MPLIVFVIGCAAPERGDTQELATIMYTVQPGQEAYYCFTFRSPNQLAAIVALEQTPSPVVHHVVLSKTTTTEDPEGFYECPELFRTNWEPIWASGTGANHFAAPDGVGFILEADTQLVVQYHLQNTSDTAVTQSSTLTVRYAADPEPLEPAGFFVLGSVDFRIPSGASGHSASSECNAPYDMNMFAAFPHMHKLGKRLELIGGAERSAMQMLYQIDPWPFDDQPFESADTAIAQGDFLRTTCVWDNPTDNPVGFGESSDDEMCFMILFYYPAYGRLADSIPCLGLDGF